MYKPTEQDILWAKEVVRVTKHGAYIEFPQSKGGHKYRFDHQHKQIILLNPEVILEFQPGFIIHQKTTEVFAAVGYEVVQPSGEPIADDLITSLRNLHCVCGADGLNFVFININLTEVIGCCKTCGKKYEYNAMRKVWFNLAEN